MGEKKRRKPSSGRAEAKLLCNFKGACYKGERSAVECL